MFAHVKGRNAGEAMRDLKKGFHAAMLEGSVMTISPTSLAPLKTSHRLSHQLGPRSEIPIRITDVNVTEVRRQDGQVSFGVVGP